MPTSRHVGDGQSNEDNYVEGFRASLPRCPTPRRSSEASRQWASRESGTSCSHRRRSCHPCQRSRRRSEKGSHGGTRKEVIFLRGGQETKAYNAAFASGFQGAELKTAAAPRTEPPVLGIDLLAALLARGVDAVHEPRRRVRDETTVPISHGHSDGA